MKLTPAQQKVARSAYVRIMVASNRGRGVVLSAEEVIDASMDDAIMTVANNDLEAVGLRITHDGKIEAAAPRQGNNRRTP